VASNDPNSKEWRLAQAINEENRHTEIKLRLDELKKTHWTVLPNFSLSLIAALAAVTAAFIAWFAWRHPVPPPPPPSPPQSASKP